MDYYEKLSIQTITLWNLFALIINVIVLVLLYLKMNKNKTLKTLFMVQICLMIWLVGKIFKTVAPTVEIKWFFVVFYYFGICVLEAAFFEFSYVYYFEKQLSKLKRILLYIIPTIQFIIIVTNPYHYLFYKYFTFAGDDFGILFYQHMVIEYAYIFIGVILCIRKFNIDNDKVPSITKFIIGFTILIPIFVNGLYITRTLAKIVNYAEFLPVIFDVTPIVFTWSFIIFALITFKYSFLNLTPIMKHEITHKMNTPICIFDINQQLIYKNKNAENTFDLIKKNAEFLEIVKASNLDSKSETFEYKNIIYSLHIKKVKTVFDYSYIVAFSNITPYYDANEVLSIKTENLSEANKIMHKKIDLLKVRSQISARNYVAMQLHDIIGHSLVVTIKLFEVCKMYYIKDKEKTKDLFLKAKNSINNSLIDIKKNNYLNDSSDVISVSLLKNEIADILKTVKESGIEVNYFFKNDVATIDDKIFSLVKVISTELITNILKHSKSTKLLLAISIEKNIIAIKLMDNGLGCDNIIKGNGLLGIDLRVSEYKGKTSYSSDNNGFITNVEIPIDNHY